MSANLGDFTFMFICALIGATLVIISGLPFNHFSAAAAMVLVYFVLVCPVYRTLKFRPILQPRCPCCKKRPEGYYILGTTWPRSILRCSDCSGEFVIWFNGKPGTEENWERPVLALKWPYAWGRYCKIDPPRG